MNGVPAALALALLATAGTTQAAEAYPARPVRLVIPFAPGGTNDIIGRLIAQKLTERLGQQFVADNRGGAGGSIGVELAARAAPDGYTLVLGHIGTLAVNPTLYTKLGYDPRRDFEPITLVSRLPNLLAVHPSVPAQTVAELISLARAKPGGLTYGSGGTGGAGHLATEYFKLLARVQIVHVPYRGTGLAVLDVVSGQLNLVLAGVPGVVPMVRAGKLRALGVSSATRVKAIPDVPTIAEAGLPGYEATQWYGILAPARTPRTHTALLHDALAKIVDSAEVRERLALDGAEPAVTTGEEFRRLIVAEIERWAPVIKAAGLQQ